MKKYFFSAGFSPYLGENEKRSEILVVSLRTEKRGFAGDFASRLGTNPLVCREQTRTLSDFVRVFPAVRFNTYEG